MAHFAKDARSPAHSPRFVGYWKDPDGTRRSRRLDGVTGAREARARIREIETRLAAGLFGDPKDQPIAPGAGLVVDSIETWSRTLKNRNGYSDGQQARKWLVTCPILAPVPLDRFDLSVVKSFVGGLEAPAGPPPAGALSPAAEAQLAAVRAWSARAGALSPGSRKNLFTILSRWASQATWDGLIQGNPCRDLPRARRPPPKAEDKTLRPWVKDDEELHKLMAALPHPLELALWLGNRSGLRLGETFGLRLSDTTEIEQGWIRVCRSFAGPIKESKRGEWGTKWVPATVDTPSVLGPLILARRALGATDDDLLFVPPKPGPRQNGWKGWLPHTVELIWRKVKKTTGYRGDWKSATRHSFASRHISNGEPIEAVSRALNHATTKITRDAYEHVLKTKHSDTLRAGSATAPPRVVPEELKKLFGLK